LVGKVAARRERRARQNSLGLRGRETELIG
jgi:hypothetical protein